VRSQSSVDDFQRELALYRHIADLRPPAGNPASWLERISVTETHLGSPNGQLT
jgi:hypothetical protein